MKAERLAIVGPFTWEPLVPELEAALRKFGLAEEVAAYGFGRDMQVFSGGDEDFESRPPRGAIVVPDARLLFQHYLADPRCERSPQSEGEQAADFLCESVRRVSARHSGISWIVATADAMFPGSADAVCDPQMDPFAVAVNVFNACIAEACCREAGWSLFDRRRLTSLYGAARLYDARLDMLGRFPGSAEGMRLLAERLAAHWGAVQGKTKKVLALDCDNTLWGGIVGEDGVDGIQLGSDGVGRGYLAFQQAVLALESRGTLLALCSRNNPEDVDAVFANRPEMAIPRDRIAAAHIGWGPKSEGLQQLASTLGLGLDSFVFVDDNPVEREEVRHTLPEVAVPDFPADPAELAAFGYDLGWRYFYRLKLDESDRGKTEQYRARAQIESERWQHGNPEEFLESLQMKAILARDSVELIGRNSQLSQKTNQFNLTLRRYAESDVRRMTGQPDCTVFSASLQDRFCDHGWTALAVLQADPECDGWFFDTFLVSCRVLGRGFEQRFATACIEHVRKVRSGPVRAEYVPGPRNSQTADFFPKLGFRLVSEAPDGHRVFELGPDEEVAHDNGFVEIAWRES